VSLPEPPRSPGRLLVAGALIVAGMIILAPSGAFTIAILHYFFENLIQNPSTVWHNVSTIAPFEAEVFAGLAAGGSLLWAGIRIGRRR
jgi:hypothetical protein